ncbi:hypothetical protein BDP27DRAFT_1433616 [Rhodocollybia butyracea]|uniref:Uncharacterized protein n=1 Tax=Rhodocollybia butyracea TaxID=206335 RepID=A0A9P5P7D5_9AGAR|nr:hypothetical protein BDP27DRAFT_1433616 [Rhodocollybia butyracea]
MTCSPCCASPTPSLDDELPPGNSIKGNNDLGAPSGYPQAEVLKERTENLAIILVNELKGKTAEGIEEKLRKDIEKLESDLKYIQSKLDQIVKQDAFLVIVFRWLNKKKVRGCVEHLTNALESLDLARQIVDANALVHLSHEIITFYEQQEAEVPREEVGVPQEEVGVPQVEVGVPQEEVGVPQEEAGVPQEEVEIPQEKVGVSQEKVGVPQEEVGAPQGEGQVQQEVEIPGQDMKAALAILAEKNQANSSSPRRGVIPVAPDILFGRDIIVDNLACMLISQKNSMARICLLGSGGMGKTSVARAVLHHRSVIEYFGEENRVWVPCIKATSLSLLHDTLYDSLGVSLNTGDQLRDIIHNLKSSKSPIILLLDSFETPWNLHSRAEVQEVLVQLANLEHVALFVTMRSSEPPGIIPWETVHLKAVGEEASIRIYAEIDPLGSQSSELTLLLDRLGHIPLAITLMAKFGKNTGSSPAKLLEQYEQGGTASSDLGESAGQSMDVCIGLLVESLTSKDSDDSAAKLLAVLALLPAGTTLKILSQWWARNIVSTDTIISGLETLLDTSLVEEHADIFFVPPVIRRYLLDPKRFPEAIWRSTVQTACAFLKAHNGSLGDSNYVAHKHACSLEEENLQGTLLGTTAPANRQGILLGTTVPVDLDIIDALLVLSEHQAQTRPQIEVAQRALGLSENSQDPKLYAEALYWDAQNLVGLDRYKEAIDQLCLARAAFLSVPEPKRAADALYWIGNIPSYTSQPNCQDLEKALKEFKSLRDPASIVLCRISLASTADAEPITALTSTREFCISNDLPLQQAECTQRLTQAYINDGRLNEAKQYALFALEDARKVNLQTSEALEIVGTVCISLGDYEEAVGFLMEGLESSKAYGSALYIARALFQLGRAWMKKGQTEDAQGAFLETLKYCEMIQGAWEAPESRGACRFYLDKPGNPSREPNSEERENLWLLRVMEDYDKAAS